MTPGVTIWRCRGCGARLYPQRLLCPHCHGSDFDVERAHEAVVEEVSVIRHMLGQENWQPRRIANVRIKDGPPITIGLTDDSKPGDGVALFEEGTATNVGFAPEQADAVAERHNRPLVGALDSHHLHFYLPGEQVEAARDWYVEHFGAVPGLRWRYLAADLPGMNLNFSAATGTPVSTSGRSLDHIGFEIVGLEAFCRELAAAGVVFEQPYRRISPGLAVATLTDPWGTKVELSEGTSD